MPVGPDFRQHVVAPDKRVIGGHSTVTVHPHDGAVVLPQILRRGAVAALSDSDEKRAIARLDHAAAKVLTGGRPA